MNMQPQTVLAPPLPRYLEDMQLPIVMMRDILLKTIFRKNVETVTEIARAICLPVPVTQELVDLAYRAQAPFGMDFTTVDVAETDQGPIVFEVSAFGGFRGALEGAGIDAAERTGQRPVGLEGDVDDRADYLENCTDGVVRGGHYLFLSLESFCAGNDLEELLRDRGLARPVVLKRELVDHLAGVAGGAVHRGHPGAELRCD